MVKSKTLSGKYSQKRFHHAKESATDALKATSKKAVQKTAEATGDLIGNKIADRITKVSKTSPKINSETLTNEHNKEMLKERYLSPAERQKTIDDLRLI